MQTEAGCGTPLYYCPGGWELLARLRELFGKRPQDRIFTRMTVPTEALRRFARRHLDSPVPRPEIPERVAFWDALLAERARVLDDSIPIAYLSELDQGLYGGIVGGEVRFMAHPENGWISSMVPPICRDWNDFDRLVIDHESLWYRFSLDELAAFREAAHGKFGISHFILIVFEMFGGSRAYLEMIDKPDKVRQAVDFAYCLNVDVQQTFFDHVDLIAGGTCSNMAEWIPGRIVSESIDPFHMTSVGCFKRWRREPVERIYSTFERGVLHIHANGRHLVEAVSTLRGLRALYLSDDNDFPTAFSILPKLKSRVGDLPLVVRAEFADFVAVLEAHRLPGGVIYKVLSVPDTDTANRVMDSVRTYRV